MFYKKIGLLDERSIRHSKALDSKKR